MTATVEILVVSYGSATVIERLLRSLSVVLPDTPVAIREHAPSADAVDDLRRLAAAHTAPVRIEHDPTNPGFGAGCNALAARSGADFLVFLNPDTEVISWPWSADAAPPTGTVVGAVMTEAAHEHYGPRHLIRDEIALSWLRRRPRPPDRTGYVSGAALLLDRESFDRVGGFDPQFFLFYEDIDLCLRANALGIATIVDERWSVRHARHHSTSDRFAMSLAWSYESAVRFYAKHGSPTWAYRVYKVADSLARAAVQAARRTGRARAYLQLARRAFSG